MRAALGRQSYVYDSLVDLWPAAGIVNSRLFNGNLKILNRIQFIELGEPTGLVDLGAYRCHVLSLIM